MEDVPNKKSVVFEATLKLIAEQGFQGAPMSQIAQEANIGVGSIYRYFANKDDLVNALYLDVKTRLSGYILQGYRPEASVEECFRHIFGRVVRYCVKNPAELSFAEQYENSPAITQSTREEGSRISAPVNTLFKQAVAQGLVKNLPLEMLGALIYGAVISLAKLYLSGNVKITETSLNAGLDAVWDMIKR